jgi:hypothetical protein
MTAAQPLPKDSATGPSLPRIAAAIERRYPQLCQLRCLTTHRVRQSEPRGATLDDGLPVGLGE